MDPLDEASPPQEDEKWMDSLLGSLGAAFSDLNSVVCEQLNENFALQNNLPQGKLVSDWLALAAGVRGFDLARSSGEAQLAHYVVAPCNSLPVNPFTGQKDDAECLLEAMSSLPSDSWEARSRAAYARLTASRIPETSPREFLAQVAAFNRSLESLLASFDDKMPKPAPFRGSDSLLLSTASVRGMRRPKDEKRLEQLLADAKFCRASNS